MTTADVPPSERERMFMALCRYEAECVEASLGYSMGKTLRKRLEAQRDRLLLLGEGKEDAAYVHRADPRWNWVAREREEVAKAAAEVRR